MTFVDRRNLLKLLSGAAAGGVLTSSKIYAAEYPSQIVKIICPFPAGGTADIIARTVAQVLGDAWGKPVVVENKPGAAGGIGTDFVAKSAPDGHTLLVAPPSPYTVNTSLFKKLPYDPLKDLAPISVVTSVPNVLVANPKVPYHSVAELVAFAKKNPTKVNYASQGPGSTAHLTMAMMGQMAGVEMTHIPYKGSAPAIGDLIAGQVDVMWDNLGATLPQIQSGTLIALAIGSTNRSSYAPNIPTMIEQGFPKFVSVGWNAVAAPAQTPPSIVQTIYDVLAASMRKPDLVSKLATLGIEPTATTPQEMGALLIEETNQWRKVIEAAGIKPE